ncbi:IQ and ubiquitin-like domain-containing protein isoform X2 [Bubalus bubalis]|uniref:IQ and ubiquitin-like domain-containing protein isoform X2 n=1 Tax=Bubalus bubalis TaxID=89462 RepID=UPI001E1B61B4|nr:IQ and ubiquitin-like domain-containing protein isoform X2 [Bubalus bubalis]
MSDQEEEADSQNAVDSSEEREDALGSINIPVPLEEVPESDRTEDYGSELDPSSGGRGKLVDLSDQSVSSLELNDVGQLTDDVMTAKQAEDGGGSLAKSGSAVQSARPYSQASLTFMEKVKAVKESLRISTKDSLATVKVILLPVGQEIVIPFRVDTVLRCLKDHFSPLLGVPAFVLQIRCAGTVLKNHETLLQHGIKPQDVVQVEMFSLHPDLYPVRRIARPAEASQVITVRVQTGIDQYQEVAVEMIKSDFHKPFLGGFRHKITGIEYHNAGTQTVPKKIPEKPNAFCRDTQTVFQKGKLQQTTNTTSTQMTKIGVYVSNITDKLVKPGKYFSAAEYHAKRLQAIIVIQTYYRRWHAKVVVEDLRRQKMFRLQWEAEEEHRKIREKEEWMKLDYYRRHNPQTKEDFELLYNALELWRQEELTRINQFFTGAERKAALCELLEKETQIIASIGRHRYITYTENQEAEIQSFLDKCSAPKTWRRFDGKIIDMDTQFTIRARELQNIYNCIMLKNVSQDERLDVLLTLKHTVKVPQDPLKFYKKIYFCHSCQLYLPSAEFLVSSTSHRIYQCRQCINLDNESRKRESYLKYKCLLQRLYCSEADYEDGSEIAFLIQLQDIQYLTENIWASQSVLSAWKDLNDLVMVRWDKSVEWSPWNCILLTKDEGVTHLKLKSIEEGYEPLFIHKIKHKHFLAKNYFSQIPLLASFLLDDGEVEEIRKKHQSEPTTKILEVHRPGP